MFLPKEVVNWATICYFSSEPEEFNYEKQVNVLGFRLKKYPGKPANKKKIFFIQLDDRQCDGKKFKTTINHHIFYPVNTTSLSFKDPQGNLHFVSKFCYIRLYCKMLKNNKKHTVLELILKFLFSVYTIFNNVTQI